MKNTIKLLMIAVALFVSGNLFAQVHSPAGTPVQATPASGVTEAQEVQGPSALEIYVKNHADDPDVQNYVAMVQKLTDPNLTATEIASLTAQLNSMTSTLNSNAQGEADKTATNSNSSTVPVSNYILKSAAKGDPSTWATLFQSTGNAQQDAQIVYEWLKQNGIVK